MKKDNDSVIIYIPAIIPIPPNHCRSDLQIKIPSDKSSRLYITVEPVVVIPLTDSKKASVYVRFDDVYIKGSDPNIEMIIQEEIVKTKASLIPSFTFLFLKEIFKIIPTKKVIKLE